MSIVITGIPFTCVLDREPLLLGWNALICKKEILICSERKSEQAHISHTPTLLDNTAHNEWQCHALLMGNRRENHY